MIRDFKFYNPRNDPSTWIKLIANSVKRRQLSKFDDITFAVSELYDTNNIRNYACTFDAILPRSCVEAGTKLGHRSHETVHGRLQ